MTRRAWLALATLLVTAFLLRLVPQLVWPSISRPDEIFQSLEPAHRLVTGWGIVSWEWREGARSWLFPGFVAGLMLLGRSAGLPTPDVLGLIAAVMALLSLVTDGVGFAAGRQQAGLPGAICVAAACAAWPDLVFYGPRTLAEVVAGHLLLLAAGLTVLRPLFPPRRDGRMCVMIGLLLGACFCLRIQLTPAAALVAWWRCREDGRSWRILLISAAGPLLVLGVVDWWSWGIPFQSVWRNLAFNLRPGPAPYGSAPASWYLAELEREWGVAAVPVAICFLVGIRRQPLFAALATIVLGSHMLVPHKELSFIYPAIPAAVIVAASGSLVLLEGLASRLQLRRPWVAVIGAGVWLAAAAGAAPFALWSPSPTVWAEGVVRRQPDLCGLGFYQFVWAVTGGYAVLDRTVPIALIDGPRELPLVAPGVNAIIARTGVAVPGFTLGPCRDGACVWRVARGCQSPVAFSTETDLIRRSE